jgi:hypothetical protein
MACGCKNKAANAGNSVVKSTPSKVQEAKPEKTSSGNRIIKREIR